MPSQTTQGAIAHRLLRRKQVEQSLGLSRSTIYARLDPNSRHYDPDFPTPIKIGALACCGQVFAMPWQPDALNVTR